MAVEQDRHAVAAADRELTTGGQVRLPGLDHLTGRDEVKFVIASRADYEWARAVIRERRLDVKVSTGELRALLMQIDVRVIDRPGSSVVTVLVRSPPRARNEPLVTRRGLLWSPRSLPNPAGGRREETR
mgnify:CR=1 FL=1